jgi:hypothetical protein
MNHLQWGARWARPRKVMKKKSKSCFAIKKIEKRKRKMDSIIKVGCFILAGSGSSHGTR